MKVLSPAIQLLTSIVPEASVAGWHVAATLTALPQYIVIASGRQVVNYSHKNAVFFFLFWPGEEKGKKKFETRHRKKKLRMRQIKILYIFVPIYRKIYSFGKWIAFQ